VLLPIYFRIRTESRIIKNLLQGQSPPETCPPRISSGQPTVIKKRISFQFRQDTCPSRNSVFAPAGRPPER
jgi:hypothetical protein